MTRYLTLFILFFASLVFAQEKATDKPAPKPQITAEQQLDFIQARGDATEAQLRWAEAQQRFEKAIKAIQAVCPDFVMNEKLRPICRTEPPVPVPPPGTNGSGEGDVKSAPPANVPAKPAK